LGASTDTKVCRISSGAQAVPSSAFSVSPWNARITLLALSGVPTVEAKASRGPARAVQPATGLPAGIRRAGGHPLVLPCGHHREGEELAAVSGEQVDHRLAIVLWASPVACVLGHRLCPQQPVPPAVLLQSC
jgi:hypothetical protein